MMKLFAAAACATVLTVVVAGCSERVPAADWSTSGSTEPVPTPVARPSEPASAPSSESAVKPFFHRWAVICSKDAQQAGLGDLVTAELSKVNDLKLVEREQLDVVTKELQLASALESQAVATRLKIGRLLKADALLLCNIEEGSKGRILKVVMAELLYGARLRTEYFAYDQGKLADLSRHCAEIAGKVREQFAGGIRQIIGVTHFVSKNLTHDDDHLQAGFARLVENSLLRQPGIAVIETEEARAISQELDRTANELHNRLTPLVVSGEFTTGSNHSGDESVRLTVRVSGKHREAEEIRRDGLSLTQAADFLSHDLPRRIAHATAAGAAAISLAEQAKLLGARAAEFSKLGAYEHAIGLREAALLLTPDDIEMRMVLFADYHAWHRLHLSEEMSVIRAEYLRLEKVPAEQWQDNYPSTWPAIHNRQYERLSAMAWHAEHIVRSRTLDPQLAHAIVSTVFEDARLLKQFGYHLQDRDVKDLLDRFFWEVFPVFPKLDYTVRPGAARRSLMGRTSLGQLGNPHDASGAWLDYFAWSNAACGYLAYGAHRGNAHDSRSGIRKLAAPRRIDIPWSWVDPSCYCETVEWATYFEDPSTLDQLYRFLTEVARPDMPPIPLMAMIVATPPKTAVLLDQGRFSENQIRQFYARLKQAGQPLNVFYARCGLLMLDVQSKRADDDAKECLAEAESLLAFFKEHGYCEPDSSPRAYFTNFFVYTLRFTRDDLIRRLGGIPPPDQMDLSRPRARPPEDLGPWSRIRFEPVGEVKTGWPSMVRCTPSMDVRWSSLEVAVMREKGVLATIFESKPVDGFIIAVAFDGENFWIARNTGGIEVVSPEGQRLGHIGAGEGLPPILPGLWSRSRCDAVGGHLHLYALGPGRCLAVGVFGPTRRVWLAAIERKSTDDNKPAYRVNVIHTATEVRTSGLPQDSTPHTIFQPDWVVPYCSIAHPERPLVCIPRDTIGSPLLVDAHSLQVSVMEGSFPMLGNSQADLAFAGGRCLYVNGSGEINLVVPPGDKLPTSFKSVRHFAIGKQPWTAYQLVEPHKFHGPGLILADSRMCYIPGVVWHRFDTRELKLERLNGRWLRPGDQFQWFAVSAHYGLVAWGKEADSWKPGRAADQLFRVIIDEQSPDGGKK